MGRVLWQVKEDVTEVETYDVKFKSAGPSPEVLEATLMVRKVRHCLHLSAGAYYYPLDHNGMCCFLLHIPPVKGEVKGGEEYTWQSLSMGKTYEQFYHATP